VRRPDAAACAGGVSYYIHILGAISWLRAYWPQSLRTAPRSRAADADDLIWCKYRESSGVRAFFATSALTSARWFASHPSARRKRVA
jgi:hypothetical protein